MDWTCPQCGERNTDSKKLCGLCGEMRPAVKAEPISVRAMGPPKDTPSGPVPQVLPGSDRWDPQAQRSGQLTEAEKKQLAEEAAQRIMGTPSGRPQSGVGCGTLILFIMFLPWSLLVLPMPGGLRNKRIVQVLLSIAAAAVLLSMIIGAILIHQLTPTVQKLIPEVKGAYTVPDN